jgi:hypothetical protein
MEGRPRRVAASSKQGMSSWTSEAQCNSSMAAAAASAQAMVNEKDAQAVSLGYAADTTKVDAKKFPKHAAAQKCSNCQLYTGAANSKSGPCSIFPGKQVAANGWCSAYVKKA